MKKISYKFFQKYIANFVIVLSVVCLGFLTFQGGTQGVFSSYKSDIIYNGNSKNNTVSLMFNVYQGNEYVEQILNILKQNNAKATFFVGGIWALKNEECFMKIYNSGNELANHGYWHKDHSKLGDSEQVLEINMTHELVQRMTGVEMTLFAPPSGAFNKHTAYLAESLKYKTIMWTRDTIDWRDQDAQLIVQRALKNVQAGDLILMHPTKETVNALQNIIDGIKSFKLNVDTVSKNLLN